MTCKDCFYYEVCCDHEGADYIAEKCSPDWCSYFKDKSKVIELPCKVGDTVYYFCLDYGTILPYFVENFNIAYLGEKDENYVYTFEANCTRENELLDSIDFEPDDIGKTVFLTKEEAEKALKELKESNSPLLNKENEK